MVVAGLLIGNHGRSFAMSPTTVKNLDLFWELIDEILNAMLFVLLGLEVLILTFTWQHLCAGIAGDSDCSRRTFHCGQHPGLGNKALAAIHDGRRSGY